MSGITDNAAEIETDAVVGDWRAVLSCDGYAYTIDTALAELDGDSEVTIGVYRRSALPGPSGSMPATRACEDTACEQHDVYLVDPDDSGVGAQAVYARVAAMADGLNRAARNVSVAGSEQTRLTGGQVADVAETLAARAIGDLAIEDIELRRHAEAFGLIADVTPESDIAYMVDQLRSALHRLEGVITADREEQRSAQPEQRDSDEQEGDGQAVEHECGPDCRVQVVELYPLGRHPYVLVEVKGMDDGGYDVQVRWHGQAFAGRGEAIDFLGEVVDVYREADDEDDRDPDGLDEDRSYKAAESDADLRTPEAD